MKKFSVLAAIVLFVGAMSFTSCKKECVCETSVNGAVTSTTTVEHKGDCSEMDVTQTVSGITQEVTCK